MSKKKTTHKKASIRHIKTGKSPGTVTYLGSREGAKSVVNIMEYNLQDIKESTLDVYAPSNFNKIIAQDIDDKCTNNQYYPQNGYPNTILGNIKELQGICSKCAGYKALVNDH